MFWAWDFVFERFRSRNVLGLEISSSSDSKVEMFWALKFRFQKNPKAKCFGPWNSVFKSLQSRNVLGLEFPFSSESKVEMPWALWLRSQTNPKSKCFWPLHPDFKRFQSGNVLVLGIPFWLVGLAVHKSGRHSWGVTFEFCFQKSPKSKCFGPRNSVSKRFQSRFVSGLVISFSNEPKVEMFLASAFRFQKFPKWNVLVLGIPFWLVGEALVVNDLPTFLWNRAASPYYRLPPLATCESLVCLAKQDFQT